MSDNILKITFDASTLNGIISEDIQYSPMMSNPELYSSFPYIFFIPSIKLDNVFFENDLGEEDKKKIFLSSSQFENFIIRLKEKKIYKKITIDESKKRKIIDNNINFILNLFFSKGNKLFINTKPYIINSYKWNKQYNIIPNTDPANISPTIEIKLSFVLHSGKELSFIDSTRLNCMQKKQELLNDYYYLVGLQKPPEKRALLKYQPVDTTSKPVPDNLTTTTTTTSNPLLNSLITTTTTTTNVPNNKKGGKKTKKRIYINKKRSKTKHK